MAKDRNSDQGNAVIESTLSFSTDDLFYFHLASHDHNPLHMDQEVAHKSAYGQRVVYGVLAGLACLEKLPGRRNRFISRLEMEFRNPVFLDIQYQLRVNDENKQSDNIAVELYDGDLLLLKLQVTYSQRRAGSGIVAQQEGRVAASGADIKLRTTPKVWEMQALVPDLSVDGEYIIKPKAVINKRKRNIVPRKIKSPYLDVLMLSSYLIGMELPGRDALFAKLALSFNETTKPQQQYPRLQYQVRNCDYEPDFGLLTFDLSVASGGSSIAGGKLSAFVRKAINPVAIDQVKDLLTTANAGFSGKVALVTGASRGLGAAIAQALAVQGCRVIVNFLSSRRRAEALQKQFPEGVISLCQGDASSEQWCKDTRQWILQRFGRLDYLICNACAPPVSIGFAPDIDKTDKRIQHYIDVNLALSTAPIVTFKELLVSARGGLAVISSSIVQSVAREWRHYKRMKEELEQQVHALCESDELMSRIIVRPPALLTDMSNTPGRYIGAMAPEIVAAALVDTLAEAAPGKVRIIDEFTASARPAVSGEEDGETIMLAATFTIDPVLPFLQTWDKELPWSMTARIAPYNQIFQQLLDPASALMANCKGMNVIALRFSDWLRERPDNSMQEKTAFLNTTLDDLGKALSVYCRRCSCHTLLLLCPDASEFADDLQWQPVFTQLRVSLFELLRELPGIDAIDTASYHSEYQISAKDVYDPLRDEIAHIPFVAGYFSFLATIITRRFYSLKNAPGKVIVVDCDNTLWRGVCGEDGVDGLRLEQEHLLLQKFLLRQKQQGMLICLCSKNNEEDVWAVFKNHPDMVLKHDDIVAARINWRVKSENLDSLAQALNLGLDSFIFIDDNPLECADVRTYCPQVLTLQWPQNVAAAQRLLNHIWAFDHFVVTATDQQRTQLYQASIARSELQAASADFDGFLQSLALVIDIQPAAAADFARIAQLSQRTNQFNFTTIRRSENEIRTLLEDDVCSCYAVRVSDRFGDYGLVGVMVTRREQKSLLLDSFLLSCRVLGRGVEHRMLAALAEVALQQKLDTVRIIFRTTAKNKPAGLFLEQLGFTDIQQSGSVSVEAEALCDIRFQIKDAAAVSESPQSDAPVPALKQIHGAGREKERLLLHISENLSAIDLQSAERIQQIAPAPVVRQAELSDDDLYRAVLDDVKTHFGQILNLEPEQLDAQAELETYVRDSLQNVELTVALKKEFPRIPATLLFEHRSLHSIADYLAGTDKAELQQKYVPSKLPASGAVVSRRPTKSINTHKAQTASMAVPMAQKQRDIAVIGINGRYPQAPHIQAFWDNLIAGKSCLSEVPQQRWPADAFFAAQAQADKSYCKHGGFINDVDRFDAAFFNISPKEAELTDPQQRLFLEIVWGLLENAGYTRAAIGRNTGVFIGCNASDYALYANELALQGVSAYRNADYYQIANRISYFFDFQGPSICLDTACSSSGTSVYLACESLRNGNCQVAIAGGINLFLHPSRFIQYSQMQMLSPSSRCSPFGADADGTVFGEGVGAILLKPLAEAERDGDYIYGVLKGCAINSGGKTNGFTVPNPQAQAALITQALGDACIDPRTISYVEAHGTGTPLGDPIEVRGLSMAFDASEKTSRDDRQFCALGSLKANIGHLEAGAGIAGLIKILLQMQYATLVPSLNAASINPKIAFDESPFYVQHSAAEWARPVLQEEGQAITYPRRAGISSFGAGGSNAHIIVEEYGFEKTSGGLYNTTNTADDGTKEPARIIMLSARRPAELKAYALTLAGFLEKTLADGQGQVLPGHAPVTLADIAYTLRTGREAMAERLALVACDIDDLSAKLKNWAQPGGNKNNNPETLLSDVYSGTAYGHSRSSGQQSADGSLPADLLLDGPEGEEFIAQLIGNRRLGKLAQLWVSGVAIDWTKLETFVGDADGERQVARRIPLPGYCFAGDRFWLPGEPNLQLAKNVRGSKHKIHALLDAVNARLSIDSGIVFEKTLHPHDVLVKDHVVQGRTILPGAAHLAMAHAAFAQISGTHAYKLSQVVWSRPLLLTREPLKISLSVSKETDRLTYRIHNSDAAKDAFYSKGVLYRNSIDGDIDVESGQRIELEAIRKRCPQHIGKDEIYRRFCDIAMDYGAYFQVVDEIYHNDGEEALSSIHLAGHYAWELEQQVAHPAVLDGALQTALSLVQDKSVTALPFSVAEVVFIKPLRSAKSYAYVQKSHTNTNANSDTQRFQIAILDDTGLVCIKFHDLTLRQARNHWERFFYTPVWQRQASQAAVSAPAVTADENILIIYASQSSVIARTLLAHYAQAATVTVKLTAQNRKTAESAWEIDAADPGALEDCLALSAPPSRIYFLSGIDTRPVVIDDLAALRSSQETGVLALFRLLKAMQAKISGAGARTIELNIVTNNVYSVDSQGDVETPRPYSASLLGLAKVIAKEYQQLRVSCIDLSLTDTLAGLSAEQCRQLIQPLLAMAEHSGDELVVRNDKYYKQSLEPVLLPAAPEPSFRLKGVYLILGGAGGLGFEFSCYLAAAVQARLVWIGRSPLGQDQQQKINQIEALGGEALYLQADASDLSAMQQAVTQAKTRFGPIQGVVHSAMVLADSTLANMDETRFQAVLAPKVTASVVLYKVLRNEALDFFLFFSSINAFNTPMGQGNYAAGCCFKDAFARCLKTACAQPVKIINWGYWGGVGVASGAEYQKRIARQGYQAIYPKEGMEALRRILAGPTGQVIAVKADDYALQELGVHWPQQEQSVENVENIIPGDGLFSEQIENAASHTQAAGAALQTHVQEYHTQEQASPSDQDVTQVISDYIKEVFAEVIKISKSEIAAQTTFDQYGVDSLITLQLTQRFEQDLGPLSATLLFENNTLQTLQDYFSDEHKETLTQKLADRLVKRSDQNSSAANPDQLFAAPVYTPATVDIRPRQDDHAHAISQTHASARQISMSADADKTSADIAIIGLAGRYPMAADLDEFWRNLVEARNCIREIPAQRWDIAKHYDPQSAEGKSRSQWGGFIDDVDKFDCLFFNISPQEAETLDPQERIFLETVWKTVEDAGYTRSRLESLQSRQQEQAQGQGHGQGIGVFVGCMYQQYPFAVEDPKTAALLSTSSYWYIANRVSHFFNFHGPSIAVDTACSSSLSAIHMACESIRHGESCMAIAGGVNLNLHPSKYLRLDQLGMLGSSAESKSLGDGDGLIPSEGVGALMLKPLARAIEDSDKIYGVIKSSTLNHGGRSSGFMVPNPNAHADLISTTLTKAGINPRTINYVELAANGSALGDPIEIAGLSKAFRRFTKDKQYCAVGSVKSNLGHPEAASGIAQLSKVLLQLKHKQLAPSLNGEPLNPHLNLQDTPFYLQKTLGDWPQVNCSASGESLATPRRAAISSFGAGGANAHLIVEEYQTPDIGQKPRSERQAQVIVLSAKNKDRLRAYANRMLAFLNNTERPAMAVDEQCELQTKIQDEVRVFAAQVLQVAVREIDTTLDLSECGFDPVLIAGLSGRIGDCYGLVLSPGELFATPTVKAISDYLLQTYAKDIARHYQPLSINNTDEDEQNSLRLIDIAYTLQTGREAMGERLALVVNDTAELINRLLCYCEGATDIEELYEGKVLAGNKGTGFLLDDEEGRAFIKRLLSKRKLSELARLWANGIDVDWQSLYAEHDPEYRPRRISLPTYPFARQRHWPAVSETTLSETTPMVITQSDVIESPKPMGPPAASQDYRPEQDHSTPKGDDFQARVAADLAQMISVLLKIDMQELDVDEDIRAYGFDSIRLVTLAQRLSEKFAFDIAPDLFLAHPSVSACAQSLWQENKDTFSRYYQTSESQSQEAMTPALERMPGGKTRKPVLVSISGSARSRPSTNSKSGTTPIAIIGVAGTMPQSADLHQFWDHLLCGRELISEIPRQRWNWKDYYGSPEGHSNKTCVKWGSFMPEIDRFDSLFFGISPREAELMDPRQRLFLETVWNAIENAGYASDDLAGTQTGLFVGVGNNDYNNVVQKEAVGLSAYSSTGLMINSILANRISFLFDFRGPSEIVDTACSSSTVALHRAARAITSGECDTAIAGGVNILLNPRDFIILDKSGILSTDGKVRLFDEAGTGYVRGEGVGAVLLKALPQALDDRDHIYAVIRASTLNHDGRSYSLTAPNPDAQTQVVQKAYQQAALDPRTISYIEAQGTGLPIADPVEIKAFKKAFATLYEQWDIQDDEPACGIGYLKPNIGHLECASGIAALLKILFALQYEKIPATRNINTANASRHLQDSRFCFVNENRAWRSGCDEHGNKIPRRAGLHSFGFGGVNAHLVLEEHISSS